MGRGIDDQIAQRAIKPELAGEHADGLGRCLRDIEMLLPQLGGNGGDELIEPDHFRRDVTGLLAHEQNGAVGDPLELIEIGQPLGAVFLVGDELGPETHAGDRRAQIVTRRRDQPHAALHGALEARRQRVQGPGGGADLGRPPLRQLRQHGIGANGFNGAFEQHQRPHHAVRHEHRDRGGADGDQQQPFPERPPRHPARRQIGNRHHQPATILDGDRDLQQRVPALARDHDREVHALLLQPCAQILRRPFPDVPGRRLGCQCDISCSLPGQFDQHLDLVRHRLQRASRPAAAVRAARTTRPSSAPPPRRWPRSARGRS